MDWWCPRAFDSRPALWRLLDPGGPAVCVALRSPTVGRQFYDGPGFVLHTVLTDAHSIVEITDVLSSGRIVRQVLARRGRASVSVNVTVGDARDVSVWSEGVAFDGVMVRCGLPFRRVGAAAEAVVELDVGESFVVTIDPPGVAGTVLSLDDARRVESRSRQSWSRLAGEVAVEGVWGGLAARSAQVVAALSGIAGAPVSSPATSLPRVVGGERQRDGRVVHPVDAAEWAVWAARVGLAEEAASAVTWMTSALDHEPPLPRSLAPDGSFPSSLAVLPWAGFGGSQPVVIGTDAADRPSVEPAAAVVGALSRLASSTVGGEVLAAWDRVVAHADWVATNWEEGGGSSRIAARAALVAAAESARERNPLDLDAAGWLVAARDIERWLLGSGVDRGGVLASDPLDASLLRVAWLGPWPADDHVVRATVARISERLGDGPWISPWPPGWDDGLPGVEPPSVTSTLWLARALALDGRWEEAHLRMEAAVGLAGDLHLLPESVDAVGGSPLGNRPCAAAHLAFIAAAAALADAPD